MSSEIKIKDTDLEVDITTLKFNAQYIEVYAAVERLYMDRLLTVISNRKLGNFLEYYHNFGTKEIEFVFFKEISEGLYKTIFKRIK